MNKLVLNEKYFLNILTYIWHKKIRLIEINENSLSVLIFDVIKKSSVFA